MPGNRAVEIVDGQERRYRIAVKGRIVTPGVELSFRPPDGCGERRTRALFLYAARPHQSTSGAVRYWVVDGNGAEHVISPSLVSVVHDDRELPGSES